MLAHAGFREIVLSAAEPEPPDLPGRKGRPVRWIEGPAGRAAQLNRGWRTAAGEWVWLLHADARPSAKAIEHAARQAGQPPGFLYFALAFADDGPALARLNAKGANLRSSLFGLPFGDQGYLVHRAVFERVGGFDENLDLGEDLDFVVRARAAGCPPRRLPGSVTTSARRYREHGWLATTARHAWLTIVLWIRARRRSRKHST